jgi:hypothetical protein
VGTVVLDKIKNISSSICETIKLCTSSLYKKREKKNGLCKCLTSSKDFVSVSRIIHKKKPFYKPQNMAAAAKKKVVVVKILRS